ncbi:MAG TPA: HEAT repeat domain-containing protein [Longimicrobiales bacterium]|nr:HEAT repeat domain-containing protein [Longimicrobiales bacterium]
MLLILLVPIVSFAQERGPQAVSAAELQKAIDQLGNLDFPIRMNASRTVRRAPPAQAVPALVKAVEGHKDGYVRFRALVLLTGFNDPRTTDIVRGLLTDPNNRLREVSYTWYEHHPNPAMIPQLAQLLEKEQDEFLRPAIIRALAAHGTDPRVQKILLPDVKRGQDFFRSAVIEALGDYRAAWAVSSISEVAKLDGPLQDDAVIALGRIGDKGALETLAGLQRTAQRDTQPAIAAAICLLGVNCPVHEKFLAETLRFASGNIGWQELLRGTAAVVAALGSRGNQTALQLLLDVGVPATDNQAVRGPLALAAATVAIRNTPLLLAALEKYADRDGAVELLAEGFDQLEEDYDEERFFATVRRGYWQAPEGSPSRAVAELLVQKLEF